MNTPSYGISRSAESTWQHSWPGPLWLAVAAAILVAGFWLWLYRREVYLHASRIRHILVALRIAASWLLIWMMFGWLQQQHRTEPPDLIFGIDDSASMSWADDEWDNAARSRFKRILPADQAQKPSRFQVIQGLLRDPRLRWLQSLVNQYQVKVVLVADSAREMSADSNSMLAQIASTSATRPASRLGSNLQLLLDNQRGRPTAAIVMLTDGNTTDGPSIAEAAQLARQRGIPLFLVGIGNEKPIRDLRLGNLLADDVAFVDDLVSVSCQLMSHGFAGQKTTVQLKRTDTGELLAERGVVVPADGEPAPIQLTFRAAAVGDIPLTLSVTPLLGEANLENNRLSHQLTVQDATIRILLVQSSPSYEFRYLKNLLSRATKPSGEKTFQLTTILQEADRDPADTDRSATAMFPLRAEELLEFDTVIIGDADPAFFGTAAASNLEHFVRERGGGVIFMAGPQFMPLQYRSSNLTRLFPFDISTATQPTDSVSSEPFRVQLTPVGQLFPPCQLLVSAEENARLWNSLPNLYWHLDIANPSPGARILLQHPTRAAANGQKLPLVLMHYYGAGQVLFQAIDETYRWSRHEGNDEYYARYWTQIIRAMCRAKLLSDRSPADISIERSGFLEGEDVPLRVRFWQAGLAPQPPEPVTLMIENEKGIRQSAALKSQVGNPAIFSGAVSGLGSGQYRVWLASPTLNPPAVPRSFAIAPPAQEQTPRPMNAVELEQASKTSGGRFYTLRNVDRLLGDLPRGQRVRIESLPPQPIWNSPFVAAAFVLLLTTEWILRKRVGLL
jgi:hypothetical protein